MVEVESDKGRASINAPRLWNGGKVRFKAVYVIFLLY